MSDKKIGIPLSKLGKGKSTFAFSRLLTDMTAEASDIFSHVIKVIAHVTVIGDEYLLELGVQGEAQLVCDRCGADFSRPITGDVKTLYILDKAKAGQDESGEVRWLPPHVQELDITPEVLDALFLSIPSKRVCQNDCLGLCPRCGADLNKKKCRCSKEEMDPRWDALKDIKF